MSDGRVVDLDHVVLRVRDLEESSNFYVRILNAVRVDLDRGRIGLRFGERQINLHDPKSTPHPLPLLLPDPGSGDLCFLWEGTAEAAIAHLRARGVEPELGPVPRTGARGSAQSVYFRDPDGNLLELASYS